MIKLLIMVKNSEQGGEQMNNGNGNSNHNKVATAENKQLKSLLQKAVKAEKAPDSLRQRISRMIREKWLMMSVYNLRRCLEIDGFNKGEIF